MINSTIKNLDKSRKQFNVFVSQKKVDSVFEKKYHSIQKKAKIHGFRKGKAPFHLICKNYKHHVYNDVLQEIINRSFEEAVMSHNVIPIGLPKIDFSEIEMGKDFEFQAKIEVWPQNKVQIKSLDINIGDFKVSEEECEKRLEELREQEASYILILEDRPSQDKDALSIDYSATVDGKPFKGSKVQNIRLEIGSPIIKLLKDFEEGITGMKMGEEKTFLVRFPKHYQELFLAGRTAIFTVKVRRIFKKVLPEVNKEFIQKINSSLNTPEELKQDIKEAILQEKEKQAKENLMENILKALRDKNKIESFPPNFLKTKIQMIYDDVTHFLKKRGANKAYIEEYIEQREDHFEQEAKEVLHSQKLLADLARQENIFIDVEEEFLRIFPDESFEESKIIQIKDDIREKMFKDAIVDIVLRENHIDLDSLQKISSFKSRYFNCLQFIKRLFRISVSPIKNTYRKIINLYKRSSKEINL